MEATHVMEVAQLLLSLIHSWGIDLHLDKVCETQLGLLRPMVRCHTLNHFTDYSMKKINTSIESIVKTIRLVYLKSKLKFILDSCIVWSIVERWLYVAVAANLAE